jgi:hypothetical protein
MKLLINTLSLVTLAATALAQNGTICIWDSAPSTYFHTNAIALGGSSGNTLGGNFYYEVLTAPSTVTTVDASLQNLLTGTWSDTGVSGTNTSNPNPIFAGRVTGLDAAPANNWAVAVRQSFIVVGWSATLGSTWSQVKSELAGATLLSANSNYYWDIPNFDGEGFLGATTVGSAIAGPANGGAPALLFASTSSLQTPVPVTTTTELYTVADSGLLALVVPEPSTLALTGLGAAVVVIVRRKKQETAF